LDLALFVSTRRGLATPRGSHGPLHVALVEPQSIGYCATRRAKRRTLAEPAAVDVMPPLPGVKHANAAEYSIIAALSASQSCRSGISHRLPIDRAAPAHKLA